MLNVQAVRRVPPARARAAVLLAVRPRLPPALHRTRRRACRSVPRQCLSVVQCRECRVWSGYCAGARVQAVRRVAQPENLLKLIGVHLLNV